jgi:hypothetical protein
MLIALKGACLIAGLCLIVYVLFSYEDEEKRVKSWIEDAWLSLEETDAKTSLRLNAALVVLSQAASSFLARVYGEKLLSVRAVLVPLALAMGGLLALISLAMSAWMLSGVTFLGTKSPPDYGRALIMLAPFLFGCAIFAGSFAHGLKGKLALGAGALLWLFFAVTAPQIFGVLTTLGFGFDTLSIALVRRLLRKAEQSTSLARTVFIMGLASVAVPFLLALIGVGFAVAGMDADSTLENVEIVAACAMVAVLSTTLLFVVLLVCIAVRVIIGVAPRVVYSISKFKLLENRKSTMAVAIALVGVWLPEVIAPLEKWAKVFGA